MHKSGKVKHSAASAPTEYSGLCLALVHLVAWTLVEKTAMNAKVWRFNISKCSVFFGNDKIMVL